jgi:hypothetical protein
MENNFYFTDHFSDTLRAWGREEINNAFRKCCAQFEVDSDAHKMPRVDISPGYGGSAHYDFLKLSISPNLEINPGNENESRSLKVAQQLIHHEMVHIFQQQLLGQQKLYALQTWFSEGMAVALSGQPVIWEGNDFLKELDAFEALPDAESYLIMSNYLAFDMSKSPFDSLYAIWGLMFLYSISDGESLHPDYKADDGPHLTATELKRAVAIVRDTPDLGFETALQLHSNKASLTASSIKNEVCSFIG